MHDDVDDGEEITPIQLMENIEMKPDLPPRE